MKKLDFDIIVVGGGMVGASTALALAALGLNIAIVEAQQPQDAFSLEHYDLRVSAISLSSQQFLTSLGAWPLLRPERVCAYDRLAVWENADHKTEFTAALIEQTQLGAIVENRLLQLTLWQQMQLHDNITVYCPEQVSAITTGDNSVAVALSQGSISARWLVAADGANSKLRQLASIGVTGWEYAQSAMLINVKTTLPPQSITWQQFYPSGPRAFLPLPQQHASLVWYDSHDKIKQLLTLTNSELQQQVMSHFPAELGPVTVLDKAAFTLKRQHANHYVRNRVVLIGDAAHVISPLAGQGVNLGFKDVKQLQLTLAHAIGQGDWPLSATVFDDYERLRRPDNLLMMTTMDLLAKGFSNELPLIKFARNLGLAAADKFTPLKRKALAYACGLESVW